MAETGAVEAALLALLRADAALLALCPDGVQYSVAERDATHFVLVDRREHLVDGDCFGEPFGETFVYLVTSVFPETTGGTARQAAARIRALLDGSRALQPDGYGLQAPIVEVESWRPPVEVDPQNPDRRVQQWGGLYSIAVQRLN